MPPRRSKKVELDDGEWFDLEVKQVGNSKTQFETAKKKQENISEWNYLPPMGHCSDIFKYKNEEGETVIAIIAIGGQDWKDPTRAGQISADIFLKVLLVTEDEVAGLGPFRQIKAIKAVSSKQPGSMADGFGSMLRPVKNATINITKSDNSGTFEAIIAVGELLEAGGKSNLTSDLVYKISGNASSSTIEDITLYPIQKPKDNEMYGGPLPDHPLLSGHKPTSRRGHTGTGLGNSLILYVGGVQHKSQLLKKAMIPDPFLLLESETMKIVNLGFEGTFRRAHHCTEFIKELNKVVVCGGMLVPEVTGSKVSEWFPVNEFSIYKLDFDLSQVVMIERVTVSIDVESPLQMQGVASAVFGTDVVFAGGFIKPSIVPKFGKAPPISSNLMLVDFKKMTAKILDSSDEGRSAQASLAVLDSKSLILIGGSMEALRIFTTKPMIEEKPCVYAEKCKVFQKVVKSEIEKLEISCESHEQIFSHVLCDLTLKMSIPIIKKSLKSGKTVSYSCPVCKGSMAEKRKKK